MVYTARVRWTDDAIKAEVLNVKNVLCIDRMPTRNECERVTGDTRLTNAVTRRFGWYRLAAEMGLPIKECSSTTGKAVERTVRQTMIEKGFQVLQMKQNHPYDLLVNDCVKVDVKASRLYRGPSGEFFSFGLGKACPACDFFVLVTLDESDSAKRTMVVPSRVVMFQSQISVGAESSKYHAYTDRWELIRKAVQGWEALLHG